MRTQIKSWFRIFRKTDYTHLVENGAIVLDVRNKHSYTNGHIEGSMNIPLEVLSKEYMKIKDKKNPIIICSDRGGSSLAAKRILKSNDFSKVYDGGKWDVLQKQLIK